jgi:methionyl-tRNA formyltransferase
MKQKIVFFGSGWFVIPVVEKLIPHGLDLVVTTEKDPNSPLLKFCSENNLQTISASTAEDLVNSQSSIVNHSVAVLASFGAFISNEIIGLFPEGIINIHPSLLPKYKGPSPIQYSLLNGDAVTGVTLIKLDEQIDHGPVLSQKPYTLQGAETSQDLLSILFEIGAEMVEEVVLKFENGETINETPQDHSLETWSYKIEKKDGFIDISSPNFSLSTLNFKLENMIRAYFPWPGVWFICHSERNEESKLNGKIIKLLPEGKIQVEGKNPMSYKDFINGFGDEGKELLDKLGLN